MANKYTEAPQEVYDLVKQVLEEYYPDHAAAGTTFEVVFGFSPLDDEGNKTGPAIKENGYPTNGNSRICGLKERVMGRGDAEITLDGDQWGDLSTDQQLAVVDHEVHKIVVRRSIEGEVLYDTAGRPKLQKRQYDVRVGWFSIIAERHGVASSEVTQAKQLFESKEAQYLFPFVSNKKMKRLPTRESEPVVE